MTYGCLIQHQKESSEVIGMSETLARARFLTALIASSLFFNVIFVPHLEAQPIQEQRARGEIEAGRVQSGGGGCLNLDPIEREAKVAFFTQKRNRARTLAEQALEAQEKPILGAFILAQVYEESEGNFPKALYWVREATKWLTERCGRKPKEPEAQQLHKDLLIRESFILGDMDRREDQLRSLARYDNVYQPPKDELKIWPLVKLGRFDEAREIGLRQIQSDQPFVRSRAFNGLMAVECEARNRQASYDWGMKGHIDAREQSCVIALNMGLASRQCFKFDEEERFNRIALTAEDRDCSSSPYIQSSATYLIRGEFQKSISALSSWAPSTAIEWMQSHMRVKARRAELMYGLGVWERGLREIYDVVTYPDRAAGTDSASEEMLALEAYMLYWALLDGERIAAKERNAVRGAWAWLKAQPENLTETWRRWKVKRQIVRYATYDLNLIDLIRPYFSSVMPWYSATLTSLLGGGVIRAALNRAREEEQNDLPEIANAYLDGFEGELYWREGDYEAALELIERALTIVPKEAKLYRYRLIALRWAARSALSGTPQHDDDLHLILREYPLPIRLFDLRIPVQVSSSSGQWAAQVTAAIDQSPRFLVRDGSALTLQVIESPERLELCLINQRGSRYRCAETLIDTQAEMEAIKQRRTRSRGHAHDLERTPKDSDQEKEDSEEHKETWRRPLEQNPALRLIDRAHQELFSPQVELTQKEMDTLDGNIRQLKAEDAIESLY